MPTVPIYNRTGKSVGDLPLADDVFGVPVKKQLVHRVVTAYLANQRAGTAATKTRAEVRGGGRKPWRQKGTGRARHGSIRSPIWRGGGVTFGPQPRKYTQTLSKKLKRLAMKMVLSDKVAGQAFTALESLTMKAPKTKEFVGVLKALKLGRSVLLVTKDAEDAVYRSAANVPGVTVLPTGNLTLYAVVRHENLVMTKDAVAAVEEALKS